MKRVLMEESVFVAFALILYQALLFLPFSLRQFVLLGDLLVNQLVKEKNLCLLSVVGILPCFGKMAFLCHLCSSVWH